MILLFEMDAGERKMTTFMAEEHFSSAHSESDQKLDPPPCSTPPLHYHIPQKVGTSYCQIHRPISTISGDWMLDSHLGLQHMDLLCQNEDPGTQTHSQHRLFQHLQKLLLRLCAPSNPDLSLPFPPKGPACLAFIFLLAKLTVNCTGKRNMPNVHVSTIYSITGRHP